MAIDPTIIGLSIGAVVLILVFALLSGSPFLSIVVILILLGILVYVLNLMGIISISKNDGKLDVNFRESSPAPIPTSTITSDVKGASLQQKEVFYIAGNNYTYDEAPAVCAAYESELATYDQLIAAHASGAEWCGYGWTQGGMALFPTQQSTWTKLMGESDQAKRTQCGRPGVNGGYFDPKIKMGVNCYGVKPEDMGTKFPVPIPGTDQNQFNSLVNKFKSMTKSITVTPFNRNQWSMGALSATNTLPVNK